MEDILKLITNIENCLLPKLENNFDEYEKHVEYELRFTRLGNGFPLLIDQLNENMKDNFKADPDLALIVLSSLVILYKESQSDGPWNTEESKKYAVFLNRHFEQLYGITMDQLLQPNDFFDNQTLFDKCIENLHRKLTLKNFKKFPGRVEVYCLLIQDIESYHVYIEPHKLLPVSLLLIDDHISSNKIKGLKCCKAILECMSPTCFQKGNYYEVIFISLKKCIPEKDIQATKLILDCFLLIIEKVPDINNLKQHMNNLYLHIVEQLYIESNLYKRATLLKFLAKVIALIGVDCVMCKKKMVQIFCNDLDVCTDKVVGEILLAEVLECLQTWMKYCWCVTNLSSDQEMLLLLLKVLYVYKDEKHITEKVQTLIIIIVSCFKSNDQKKIMGHLKKISEVQCEKFKHTIEELKRNMNTYIHIQCTQSES